MLAVVPSMRDTRMPVGVVQAAMNVWPFVASVATAASPEVE